MKWIRNAGEILLGIVVLLLTMLSMAVAAIVSLFELPKYWRHTHK